MWSRVWTRKQKKVAIARRSSHGEKKAGRDFYNHLRSGMEHLGFISCLAASDAWTRTAMKANCQEYYESVPLYTDDTLVVSD